MAGGYGTGDGVPGRDGDGTADRPGPLPPRIAPPGASHPAAHPTYPTSGADHPAAPPYPGYPARSGAAGPSYGATARAASPVVPAQPNPGPAYPGPSSTGSGSSYPGQSTPGSPYPGQSAPGSSYPGQPGSGSSYPARAAAGSSYPAPPASGAPYPGQPASYPAVPASASPYPGPPVPGPAFPGQPISGPAYPGQPSTGPGQLGFGASGVRPDPSGRRGWLPLLALALAGVLAVVTGVQAYQIHRLDDRLAAADRRTAEAQGADARRLDGLEQRAGSLEKQAGAAFNPEAVASAVLPSVFRVRAGQFTGTAFAVGKAPSGGGTTLLTNFHVVESVFAAGERKVFLERTDQRFEATIVATDKEKDLAQLRTTAKFGGLVAARTPVKSGQQIVVVGAPLGLQDSVTTGVVSAFRQDEGGSGPVIQFDAPINPGNSGGPVINGSKEVVGIATAKARDAEGIGLAVPIKTACDRFKLC
ncbi:trypsin-like peptidase domain-containing protein [Micromonospora sp. WMMC241]|uniref:trypsin-like peptidase domain-containing protein n=1 Tax=Micromonospora sp. WMMC241 TaxID=3015159 RepID=UPI0022B71DB9|nr:trypsin-like peptidase domain-containing protein [Micromonospora sp. WMMC241]MCZ7438972.1 trypsin-like peptidase domain-containing protein [Micromonospora sp. WMMC241]